MSLILDALNRAEHERKNQNTVPDINTLHRPQALNTESSTRRNLWWAIGAVLVLIAIILALLVVLRRESGPALVATPPSVPPSAPVEQQAPSFQQPEVVQPSGAAVAPVSSARSIPTPATVPKTSVITTKTPSQPSVTNADVDKLYAAEDTAAPVPVDSGVNELYAAEAATTAASETVVDPFNSAGNAAAQEQAPPRTFDSIKNIPDFNALPWNMRQKIPTITYARHNYLAGGVSSVVINNQTTGVGNIIGTGQFIVQEIYVDGVVLKHGNAVFKLRALTGWINM